MKQIKISDVTLCDVKNNLSFKQKLEIARKLDRLGVDAVELSEIGLSNVLDHGILPAQKAG